MNAIFTGANTVYEPEIHTHLNVIAIAYTDLYDVATGSSNALGIIRTNFATGKSAFVLFYIYDMNLCVQYHVSAVWLFI